MPLSRTDCLLLLLYASGASGVEGEKIVGMTRLQKLLFLLGKEGRFENILSDYFSHIPYKYGPFSQELLDELEFLRELGLVEDFGQIVEEGEKQVFRLTERGLQMARKLSSEVPTNVMKTIVAIKRKYAPLPLSDILRYVYTRYPEFAVYSEANL